MKGPSLPFTAFFSFLLHLTFIFTALITIKNANHFTVPSPYIVSLVSPEVSRPSAVHGREAAEVQPDEPEQKMKLPSARSKERTVVQTKEPEQKMKLPPEPSKSKASEDAKQYISDRIAALKAVKKARHVVKSRDVVSIRGANAQGKDSSLAKGDASEAARLEDYPEKIGREIRQRWAFPEAWGKNLEAVISVTIMSNGTVKINNVEKSSGNILFDRSVLRAINKASPVSPPPHEMEIGLRFTL